MSELNKKYAADFTSQPADDAYENHLPPLQSRFPLALWIKGGYAGNLNRIAIRHQMLM